jgi:transcriptional regulator with XRE-family HTH domain
MDLAAFRASRGITLEQCAAELGLSRKSKGYLSLIENGRIKPKLELALRIEAWSEGALKAPDLVSPEQAKLLSGRPSASSVTPQKSVST